MKSKLDEEVDRAKDNIKDFAGKLGFVSKAEYDELKQKLDEMNEKMDKFTS